MLFANNRFAVAKVGKISRNQSRQITFFITSFSESYFFSLYVFGLMPVSFLKYLPNVDRSGKCRRSEISCML